MITGLDLNWSEEDWDDLLEDMRKGAVIPVVGEELYTHPAPGPDGGELPLYLVAAQELATQLKLEAPGGCGPHRPLNEVICSYLRARQQSGRAPEMDRVYDRFCDLFEAMNPQPSDALKKLAEIRDFRLLVTTTPDDLLECALNHVRFGGIHGTTSLGFRMKPPYEDMRHPYEPMKAAPTDPPVVFHLFGRLARRLPDQFVLSDDDLLEFFLAVQRLREEQLPYLCDALKRNHLLFLGGSLSDWLVRFLLRTANREHRLSKRDYYDVLAVPPDARESDLIRFLRFFSPRTKLAPCSPGEFVAELHGRWIQANPGTAQSSKPDLPRVEPPDQMPEGYVFISYAGEDREAVRTLKAHLDVEGIPAWFDRDQLTIGHDWDSRIRNSLKDCSFFVPIVSSNTQRIREKAYFRTEWRLADESAPDSSVEFILPVLLESQTELGGKLFVPPTFTRRQHVVAPEGVPPPDFVANLKRLVEQCRANPRHR